MKQTFGFVTKDSVKCPWCQSFRTGCQ